MKQKIVPRGIRNNNPLNIRIGNVWHGEVREPTDPDFEQFVSMEYGVRAGFVLLRRYIRHYKRNTVAQIISAWAPAHENNTQAYIDRVSQMMGVNPDVPIHYSNYDQMFALMDSMIFFECGQHISPNIISKGYKMA